MKYIGNLLHFYDTTESFEVHRRQGLISPDSICFLNQTGQIYTQGAIFGICKERFEVLEKLALEHDAKIKNILGIEGPSVNDGAVNNLNDIINLLDGFTEEDNLQDIIESFKTAVATQLTQVSEDLNRRLSIVEETINDSLEDTKDILKSFGTRLDGQDSSIAAIDNKITSHLNDYKALRDSFDAFKDYADLKFSSIDGSISSINTTVRTVQGSIEELDTKFSNVEKEVTKAQNYLNEAKELVNNLEERFDNTLLDLNQFKKDIQEELKSVNDSIGEPNGVAPLDETGKVPAANLPSYVDDVLEYPSIVVFPQTGETGKIYVDTDTNLSYRWSGSQYVEVSKSIGLGETSSTAYPGDKGKKTADDLASHISNLDNPHNVTKQQIGLGNVDNTSDMNKPISTAVQQALDDKVSFEPGKGLVDLKAAENIAAVDERMNSFEESLNLEIARATAAELNAHSALSEHKTDNTNPHGVTAEQVGLGNVDNTSDLDKPVSTATQEALDAISETIEEKIGNIDFSDYETIEGAAEKYQPKGDYLTEQNISNLVTKDELSQAIEGVDVTEQLEEYAKTSEVESLLDNKVDIVEGKDLSTNDFTDGYKGQLDNLSPITETELNEILN